MNNNHKEKDKLAWQDVLVMFILKAPDQKKAIAALEALYERDIVNDVIDYKHKFKSYQDWKDHIQAALDNAQEVVNGTRKTPD